MYFYKLVQFVEAGKGQFTKRDVFKELYEFGSYVGDIRYGEVRL